LGGVVSLLLSVSVVFILPLKSLSICRGKFSPVGKIKYGIFIASFLILTLIGRKPVEDPYFLVGKVSRFMYFISILLRFNKQPQTALLRATHFSRKETF